MSEENKPIVVVGAGLTGCCIALLLTKILTNNKIILFEARDDYRKELQRINAATAAATTSCNFGQFDNAAARSINLALSYRGICALKACDIYSDIIKQDLLILMKGRYVHLDGNKISKQLYGQDDQGIYSISRLTLNCLFLDKLSLINNVEIRFNIKITKILKDGSILYNSGSIKSPLFVLGADGAYSTVRASLQRFCRYNFKMNYIDHGYKELTLFPTENAEFKMAGNYLHIWPKHEFMLIGLPNPDKTFTCTLFAPWTMLETLNNTKNIKQFFNEYFPDFIGLCPNYIEQCLKNPSSPLAYINFSKWNYKNKILLLGDAAHAIVPFYGQGMNAGFEDCLILYNMLKKQDINHNIHHIQYVFDQFSKHRQPSTAALLQLSLQNYVEMRSLTAKQWFVYKKKIEKTLNFYVPNLWKPIYSMVAFSTTPYNEALDRAKKQDKYLSMALSSTAIIGIASIAMIGYKYNVFDTIKSKWYQSSETQNK